MPRAILLIRSYPITLIVAVFLFLCSLALATSSIGKMGAGGDDEGSGMGGTGRNGEFGGSGFGGTGGPSPFFSLNGEPVPEERPANARSQLPPYTAPEALAPQRPQQIDELAELVRSQAPTPPEPEIDTVIGLDLPIIDPTTQFLQDMANAGAERDRADTVLNIQLPVETPLSNEPVSRQIAPYEPGSLAQSSDSEEAGSSVAETEIPQLLELDLPDADSSGDNGNHEEERRASPERIQRPELPPFQRSRPVQRASITPPRPQPMRR